MYGVALDNAGNYLLLGGSGDEYTYSATNSAGDSSDVWVSYLVVLDPQVSINIHKLKNTLQKVIMYTLFSREIPCIQMFMVIKQATMQENIWQLTLIMVM